MSPIIISPITKLNLRTKIDTLSNYAQRFMKSQVRSVSFTLERLFLEADYNLISNKEQKLKEIGIKQIGKDIKEGIIIAGKDYDYHIYSANGNSLSVNMLKSDSNEVLRYFCLNNNSNEYTHAGSYTDSDTEEVMNKVLDYIEKKLFEAKKECVPSTETPQTLIQISSLPKTNNKNICRSPNNSNIDNSGIIGSEAKELIESITEKFGLLQGLYKRISDCRTKYEVKSSYKNYIPQPVANKLGFKNAGPNGESISLFLTSYKNNSHTAIGITDKNGKSKNFVISMNSGTVQKNLPSKYVESEASEYRICVAPDYYTQKEVDDYNLNLYLSCLNREIESFIEHTKNWFNKREEIRLIKANYDTANLEPYKDLIAKIYSDFNDYRVKIRKYLRKMPKRNKFKTENSISTNLASTSVKFDNITSDGKDLRLSFPKVRNKIATQILIMQGDKIEKSFYILDNKLMRFEIKNLNDKFSHYSQNKYYYDNKYLQESNLAEYLQLLRDKLSELNEKLDKIRVKQIKNREKYHIKSPNSKE